MKCDSKELRAYALGILDEVAGRAIEVHVESCPRCAQRLAELRRTVALLEGVPEVENEPVDIAALRVSAAHEESRTTLAARSGQRNRPPWGWAIACGTALLLFFLCFHYGLSLRFGSFEIAFGGGKPVPVSPQPAPTINEARLRAVARDEIAEQIVPDVRELASLVRNLRESYDQKLIALRNEFALLRAWDRDELRRHFKLIAGTMTEVAGGP